MTSFQSDDAPDEQQPLQEMEEGPDDQPVPG